MRPSRRSIPVLLALAMAMALAMTGASCRKNLPKPPDGVITPWPSGGAGGGTGGAPGEGGSGPETGPDTIIDSPLQPDTVDVMPTETSAACGAGGQPCCPGNVCIRNGAEGCCEGGICTDYSTSCRLADNATCLGGACGGMCGAPVAPPGRNMDCCNNRNCTKAFSTCIGTGKGTCVSCGDIGEPCCGSLMYCNPGGVCLNTMCMAASSAPAAVAPGH